VPDAIEERPMIRVQETDGVWWFVDGTGAPFVSIGVNHLQSDCWLAPYNREASLARYGTDLATREGRFNARGTGLRSLVGSLLDRLQTWGFNTIGVHVEDVPVSLYANRMYYAVNLDTVRLGSAFRFGQHVFPDVFSESFEQRLDRQIALVCAKHKTHRRLLGYAFSDIPRWYFFQGELEADPERGVIHPWVDDLRRRPADSPGKQRWLNVLRRRYDSPRAAARAHGASFKTWEQAAELKDWPRPADPEQATRDSADLIREACERWYELHVRLVRKHDPRHLLLGDKLHSPHRLPDWFLPILKRSVDVLLIQWYTPFEEQRDTLVRLYAALGKPILNGDGSFVWPDPSRQTRVKGFPVASRAEVGRRYGEYLRGIASLPFMVGWHHCGIMEQWNGAKTAEAYDTLETGFLDPFERPYEGVLRSVVAANKEAANLHRKSAAGPVEKTHD
jgi:hypothetical protein